MISVSVSDLLQYFLFTNIRHISEELKLKMEILISSLYWGKPLWVYYTIKLILNILVYNIIFEIKTVQLTIVFVCISASSMGVHFIKWSFY